MRKKDFFFLFFTFFWADFGDGRAHAGHEVSLLQASHHGQFAFPISLRAGCQGSLQVLHRRRDFAVMVSRLAVYYQALRQVSSISKQD